MGRKKKIVTTNTTIEDVKELTEKEQLVKYLRIENCPKEDNKYTLNSIGTFIALVDKLKHKEKSKEESIEMVYIIDHCRVTIKANELLDNYEIIIDEEENGSKNNKKQRKAK